MERWISPYFGGNTRVRTTLASPGPAVAVDDVRGFQTTFVNGVQTPVGGTASLPVVVGGNTYNLIGVSVDTTNNSTAWQVGGISGVLTFNGNVSVADGTQGNTVTAGTAPYIARPNGRTNTYQLQAADQLDMNTLLNAVSILRQNAVPEIDGVYNCYLDPVSARQLFNDTAFRQLFQGATSANQVYAKGMINELLGLRFIPTTEAYVQTQSPVGGAAVRRPIVCGKGALIEGDFAGMTAPDVVPAGSIVSIVDGIGMVTREPVDRLQQIIAQSWYWIGGFCAPSDTTTNSSTIGTATGGAYKRAVMIEHLG